MNLVLDFPEVTDSLLQEVVRRIRSVGTPEKIILFGSRARSDARPDSDLDLLIVEQAERPRHERCPKYYLALAELGIPKDIVVFTQAEIDEWRDVPNAFPTTAVREGKVLYVYTD